MEWGGGYLYTKIDEKILSKYDLIISIGKTINYGISLGIPCYCYDRFGGDGYLNLNNIEKSYEFNFSGRYLRKQKTGEEIYQDIIKNYKSSLKDINKLKKWAYENFCYEKMMKKTLEYIYNTKKIDIKKILQKYPTEIRRSSLFMNVVSEKTNVIKYLTKNLQETKDILIQQDDTINNLMIKLDQAMSDLQIYNNRLTKILNSKSWKITKPLRKLMKIFTKK